MVATDIVVDKQYREDGHNGACIILERHLKWGNQLAGTFCINSKVETYLRVYCVSVNILALVGLVWFW